MSRVLSTEAAKTAIKQLQNLITGAFSEQINAIDSQGQILSDPNNWDGPLAEQFRNMTWPETQAALDKLKEELEELRQQAESISNNIFSAGGGA